MATPHRSSPTTVPRQPWARIARVARLGLGGVIVGAFGGVYLGALAGVIYAAWSANLSAALDGAVIGGAALALLGGAYGTLLGITEGEVPSGTETAEVIVPHLPWKAPPAPIPHAHPAERTDPTHREHTHG
jgi:hypothetical protein